MAKERLMTASEVAGYLSCSVSTVRRLVKTNKIPHYRLGRLMRFRRGELDDWLALLHRGELATVGQALLEERDQLSLFELASPQPQAKSSD